MCSENEHDLTYGLGEMAHAPFYVMEMHNSIQQVLILKWFDLRTKSDTPRDLHYLDLIYIQYEADLMNGSEEVFQNIPKKCDVKITRHTFSNHRGALWKPATLVIWKCSYSLDAQS